MRRWLLLAAMIWCGAAPALAVTPAEQLHDPKLEARARKIGSELRCVVCQNQTIDDSDAPLASDLRVLLRQRLTAGDSDAQAIAFVVDRYGRFVLLKPPVERDTLILWWGPAVVVGVGALATLAYARRRGRAAEPPPLDEAEQARLAAIVGEDSPA
jgi:cytochrome c-type biogenesis protein CcmH